MTINGISKNERHDRIRRLLLEYRVSSQSQLVELLADTGIQATQATVSRDLDELGAVKSRVPGGDVAYLIPQQPHEQVAPAELLRRVCANWVVGAQGSGNLAVVRTPPGSAHLVAAALDRAGWESVIGTVAGDDTVLVVAAEGVTGTEVASALVGLARGTEA